MDSNIQVFTPRFIWHRTYDLSVDSSCCLYIFLPGLRNVGKNVSIFCVLLLAAAVLKKQCLFALVKEKVEKDLLYAFSVSGRC